MLLQPKVFFTPVNGCIYTRYRDDKFQIIDSTESEILRKIGSKIHIQARKILSERPCGAVNDKISLQFTLFGKKLKFKQIRFQHEVQKSQWCSFLRVFLFSLLDRRLSKRAIDLKNEHFYTYTKNKF